MVQIQGVGSLVNFPRWGVRFKPPTPPTFSSQEDSLDFKTNLPSHLVSILLSWDMEDIYDTYKRLCWSLEVVGTIKLDDFIQKFNTWCDTYWLRNPHMFILFLTWKGLFQHFKGPPMDDDHEFHQFHEVEIKDLYWLPNHFFIT